VLPKAGFSRFESPRFAYAAKAEAYFERALAVARVQQAKSRELRAVMSMARLRRDQGKTQQLRELLAPVCGWFTEGFDTLDLKEAKALLDALAQTSWMSREALIWRSPASSGLSARPERHDLKIELCDLIQGGSERPGNVAFWPTASVSALQRYVWS